MPLSAWLNLQDGPSACFGLMQAARWPLVDLVAVVWLISNIRRTYDALKGLMEKYKMRIKGPIEIYMTHLIMRPRHR